MKSFKTILSEQKEFSRQTFGPFFRPNGILDHIRKECLEIEADPFDAEEWIDIAILAFDGAMRTGRSEEEVLALYEYKQQKNFRRSWPDWTQSDPDLAIEHIRSENAEIQK